MFQTTNQYNTDKGYNNHHMTSMMSFNFPFTVMIKTQQHPGLVLDLFIYWSCNGVCHQCVRPCKTHSSPICGYTDHGDESHTQITYILYMIYVYIYVVSMNIYIYIYIGFYKSF